MAGGEMEEITLKYDLSLFLDPTDAPKTLNQIFKMRPSNVLIGLNASFVGRPSRLRASMSNTRVTTFLNIKILKTILLFSKYGS